MTYEVKFDIDVFDSETPSETPSGTPSGIVVPFTGNIIPAGWVLCDGSEYRIQDFPRLFASIQYNYGGNDDRFKVPNLKSRTIAGVDSSNSSQLPNYDKESNNIQEITGEFNMVNFFTIINSSSIYHDNGTLTLGPFPTTVSFRTGNLDLDSGKSEIDDDLETQQVAGTPFFFSGDRNSFTQTIPAGSILASVPAGQYINFRVTNAGRGRTYATGNVSWSGPSDSGTYDLSSFFFNQKTGRFYHDAKTLTIGPFSDDVTITAATNIVANDNLEMQISYEQPQYPFGLNNRVTRVGVNSTIGILPQGRLMSFRLSNGGRGRTHYEGWIHWRGVISSSLFEPITFSQEGGENFHVLTPNEMPEHHHYFRDYYQGEGWGSRPGDDSIGRNAFGTANTGSRRGTNRGAYNGYPTVSIWNRTGTTAWVENEFRLGQLGNYQTLAKQSGPWAVPPFGGKDGGDDKGHNNMPPYVVMRYIIKA